MVKVSSLLLSLCAVFSLIHAQGAVSSKVLPEIKFGQTAALSGHLGLYGSMIKNALEAYFSSVNATGGVGGYRLKLVSLDDQGDPEKAMRNIERLRKEKIDLFIGCTGTRSILAALPLIKTGKIAMLFPWAGHEAFRDKNLKYMINGLGFLKPQIEALVSNLVHKKQLKKVSIFHADDDFSTEATQDLILLLKKYEIAPLRVASYNRFTVDVITAADKLIADDPKIVLCIATSFPTVKLIDRFFEKGLYGTIFMGIDSTNLVNRILHTRGVEFTFSSSVPDPVTSKLELAKQYRQQIALYAPAETFNILSFAYYISAAIVVHAIKAIQRPVTKEKIIQHIENMQRTNINGLLVTFDSEDRHAFGKTIEIIKG